MSANNGRSFIDFVADVAGKIGFNRVRVYWKLRRWSDSLTQGTQGKIDTVKHVGYVHKKCVQCGMLQDRNNKRCENCGERLLPRFLEILNRIGLVSPHLASASSVITAAIIACYARTIFAEKIFGMISIDPMVLVQFGGNFPYLTLSGEWWRLSTAVLLHGGLWHILFNLFALQQIGPEVESVFGRGKYLFFFMVTGIFASAGSLVWHEFFIHRSVVSIGASGAIMGLVGIAAGWGHKEGTSYGRNTRDLMLKWGAYTLVFGFIIGADNAAHIAGLLMGGAIGFFAKTKRHRQSHQLNWAMTLVGIVLFVTTVLFVLLPISRFLH